MQKRVDDGIIYALFVQHAILDKDVVDMTMQVILKTGIFALEYGEWHTKPENLRTWGNQKVFMKEKCKLKKNTSNVVGQFGFGMSAATDGDYDKKMDEAYAQSMANFSAGHANTTSTISRLQDIIAKQQQQLVMMQQKTTMVDGQGKHVEIKRRRGEAARTSRMNMKPATAA